MNLCIDETCTEGSPKECPRQPRLLAKPSEVDARDLWDGDVASVEEDDGVAKLLGDVEQVPDGGGVTVVGVVV